MRQTFYIDIDEEIISVIARLRQSGAEENVLVAPKKSLMLQSIVNLKLLSREGQKLNKSIVLVTQDEIGLGLAEKAGIRVQQYLEDAGRRDVPPDYPVASASVADRPPETLLPMQRRGVPARVESIGSSSFFAAPVDSMSRASENEPRPTALPVPGGELSVVQGEQSPRQISVRDRSSHHLTALNSQLYAAQSLDAPLPQRSSPEEPSLFAEQPSSSGVLPRPVPMTPPLSPREPQVYPSETSPPALRQSWAENSETSPGFPPLNPSVNQKLHHFLNPRMEFPGTGERMTPLPPTPRLDEPLVSDHPQAGRLKAVLFFFLLVSVFSILGVSAYVFLPRADVTVTLRPTGQTELLDFQAAVNVVAPSAELRSLPAHFIEKEVEVTRSFEATGATGVSDQKAKGTVVISNEYSQDPQELIATTRLLSPDGKLFRLVAGVKVPGMQDVNGQKTPGTIEANVIADQPGDTHNIPPATFTIPGLQGGPKFAKFSARSSKPMIGGGKQAAKITTVSAEDIANAKKETDAKINEEIVRMLGQDLENDEKILDDAFEKTVLSSLASPQVGSAAGTFEYRVKVKARAFVFSEEDVQQLARALLAAKAASSESQSEEGEISITYDDATPDFTGQSLKIRVRAAALIDPATQSAAIKKDLLGKNEAEIEVVLQKHNQVEKIEVLFWPEFMTNRIPTRENRVNVTVQSASS